MPGGCGQSGRAVEDCSQVDILSSRYKSIKFRRGKCLQDAGDLDKVVEDHSQVDIMSSRYKYVNFGGGKFISKH